MKQITREKLVVLLNEIDDGTIFGVEFIKKDGSLRKMSARRQVKKGVKGVGLSFDPKKKNLLPVYDMNNGFRMVNLATVQSASIHGENYKVEDDENN